MNICCKSFVLFDFNGAPKKLIVQFAKERARERERKRLSGCIQEFSLWICGANNSKLLRNYFSGQWIFLFIYELTSLVCVCSISDSWSLCLHHDYVSGQHEFIRIPEYFWISKQLSVLIDGASFFRPFTSSCNMLPLGLPLSSLFYIMQDVNLFPFYGLFVWNVPHNLAFDLQFKYDDMVRGFSQNGFVEWSI